MPRVVFATACATSVVPMCVAAGCGGDETSTGNRDAEPDNGFFGVAAVGYCCFDANRPDTPRDAPSDGDASIGNDAADGADAADVTFAVADVGFGG